MTSPEAAASVVYVAFDGCDADIMLALASQGRCPELQALLDTGAVVDTVAPAGTYVGSSWMTISTGMHVSEHAYWNWVEFDPATYTYYHTTPRSVGSRPFWERLSDAGRRVAVLDVPHCGIPESFNGVVLKEWGCHDRHDGTASWPPELLTELDHVVGRHPIGCRSHPNGDDAFAPCDYTLREDSHRRLDEEQQLLEFIRAGVRAKRDASVHLLERGPWDFFGTVFGESHCVGHQLWHVHDPAHPWHDSADRDALGDTVEDIYSRLDTALGEVVARAGADATVYLQMNHGMGPHYDGDHLLDELLRRIDDALAGDFEPGTLSRAGRHLQARTPAALRPTARRVAAAAARWRARRRPPQPSERTGPAPNRRFFQLPGNTTVGAVRFNLIGREAHGLVTPGEELDALIAAIERALLEVIDIDTGQPLVRSVVVADSVMQRTPDDRLPDLFIEWNRSTLIERVWSPMTGTVAAPYTHWRTGDHHDRGLFVASGPGIAPGHRSAPMSLVDVAPTLAAAVGVELADVDGRVHHDLVGVAAVQRNRADHTERRLATIEAELVEARDRASAAERAQSISTTMAWLAQEPVNDGQLISVITPTHERPERLAEAIRSVIAQRHRRWEMVVVDDGSHTASAVVDSFGDERIRLIDADHGGPCAARNLGLDAATGDIITYLDDDNLFDPGWLHAVEWAFREHPDVAVLYGARIIDDLQRAIGATAKGMPHLQFEPYDRAALERGNSTDMGVIAHRAALPTRFDEALIECGDWDFFLALTEHEPPLALPVIAFYYRTDGGDRLTGLQPEDADVVRRKWEQHRSATAGVPRN